MHTLRRSLALGILLAAALAALACNDSEPTPLDACYPPTLSIEVCDPAGTFSMASTNPYFPLEVGNVTVIEGMEDGELVRVELTVLDETETVAGVVNRVVDAREFIDGALYEIARDFYAVADDGTVCYFGEDVEFYEGGAVTADDGSWRAGVDGALPGVIMPATPTVGQRFFQESAPGIAIDMSRVDATGLSVTLAGAEYTDVVRMLDSNPLEGTEGCEDEEEKLFVAGIGLATDTVKHLVSFTPGN